MSVERAGIHLSAVAVFGHFKCGVGGVGALRGFQYTFVVVVNDLLGVIHATVANFDSTLVEDLSKFVIFREVYHFMVALFAVFFYYFVKLYHPGIEHCITEFNATL